MTTKLLSPKAWFAVTLVAVILATFALSTGQFFVALAAFSSAGIAAFDSTHIHLRRYRTWMSYGPVGVFIWCALLFPFTIIWYFIIRVRIARNTMPLRDDFPRQPMIAA